MYDHLYQLVPRRAAAYPNAVAFGGQDGIGWRTVTSQRVLDLVDALAAELAACGVRQGDRVVLWLPNQPRTPLYLFALWKLGAIAVPFDREMNPEAAARIVEAVAPRLLIAGHGERPAWTQRAEYVEWWEPASDGHEPRTDQTPWTPPAEEVAAIVFTSGTTGHPKGCTITHANLCSQIEVMGDRVPIDAQCRLASILPLSHLFELTCGLLYPFSRGAAIHYLPSRRGPDVVRVLAEQRITHMMGVPQLLTIMGRALEKQLEATLPGPVLGALFAIAPLLPLRARRTLFWPVHRKLGGQFWFMGSGGAALPPETQQLWERLGVRVTQGYGASECSPVVAMGRDDGTTPLGSVGAPIRDVEVRLTPEGEVLVKGPNVMRGYWQDPTRTAEVLHDGWYATGDLARQDAAGNLFITGRAKELIVLPSGLNVWPQDVEDVLRAHPAVADAVVLPVPTPGGGAKLHAYLLPRTSADRETDVTAIVRQGNSHLAQHQRVTGATWWPEADFPRTALGKVRRILLPLPDQHAPTIADALVLADDDPVGQAIAGVARLRTVRGDQTLGQLGLDSLGTVELAQALEEKTGKAITDGDLRLDMTVDSVRELLVQAPAIEDTPVAESAATEEPLWPYTWGRAFRGLRLPLDLLYRVSVTRTVVLGGEHLATLPPRLIFAATHHSFADLPLVLQGIGQTPARRLAHRLVIATGAQIFGQAGPLGRLGVLLYGLYPLQQHGHRATSLHRLAQLAAAGNAVLIFPQGHHTRPAAEQAGDPEAAFRPGVAYLATALAAAVVPCGLAGTEQLMPPFLDDFKGLVIARIPVSIRRGPLAIAFGSPLTPEPGESPQAFTHRLQAACFALAREAEQALRH